MRKEILPGLEISFRSRYFRRYRQLLKDEKASYREKVTIISSLYSFPRAIYKNRKVRTRSRLFARKFSCNFTIFRKCIYVKIVIHSHYKKKFQIQCRKCSKLSDFYCKISDNGESKFVA